MENAGRYFKYRMKTVPNPFAATLPMPMDISGYLTEKQEFGTDIGESELN
jgi:hypothetical protein